MSTHAHVLNVMRSVAFLQRMIYRPPSQSCHRRRLESSAVIPSILWMGTGVPCLLVNRETPAWNWLLKCHICHKAKKVRAQYTEEGCDFLLFLPWSQKIHADLFPFIYPCIFMFIPPGTFPPVHMLALAALCFSFIELHIFTPRSFAVQLVFFCWLLSSCTRAGGG